ncbi:MAG: hypothetical protein [Microviridae sp.]|nr:MAG: hypothetical protein [Microviridae sp.]
MNTNLNMEKTEPLEPSQNYVPMKESRESSSTVKNIEGEINGSPFSIVTTNTDDEANSFVAIGNTRLTPLMPKHYCEDMIYEKDWTLVVQLVMHMMKHEKDINRLNEIIMKKGGTEE